MAKLSHLDARGRAKMVDVSDKLPTTREAVAEAEVRMSAATLRLISSGGLPKGDAIAVARLAGIMAAKQTAQLIPLCHPIPLTAIEVECAVLETGVRITARVRTTAPTGPEMEAMTAASVAALTLYDMVKGVDRTVEVRRVRLLEKSGGKSGLWRRDRK